MLIYEKTLQLKGIFGLLQNTQSFFGVFVTIVGIIENLFWSNFSPDIFTFIWESPKICIFLQENQIPPGLKQNYCYIGFSKITNLLKLCLLYRPFFGFFRFFSKVPKFWTLISLHFGFFGPKIPYNRTPKKRKISIGDILFFCVIFSKIMIFSKCQL